MSLFVRWYCLALGPLESRGLVSLTLNPCSVSTPSLSRRCSWLQYLEAVTWYLADEDLAAACRWRLACWPVRWRSVPALSVLLNHREPGALEQRRQCHVCRRRDAGRLWRFNSRRRGRHRCPNSGWFGAISCWCTCAGQWVGPGPGSRCTSTMNLGRTFAYLTRDLRGDITRRGLHGLISLSSGSYFF